MKKSEKLEMYANILKHGKNLNAIFNTGIDHITLCKKLRTLELKANRLACDYCNGENGVTSENWEGKCTPIMNKVYKLLNNGRYNEDRPHFKKVPIFLNGDARGYALKINDAYVKAYNLKIHTDWGGYGILAPDYTPNN